MNGMNSDPSATTAPTGDRTTLRCPHDARTENLLNLNLPLVRRILVGFVRNEVLRTGLKKVVFGLSGGIDSSLAAYIAAEALGPENVLGVRMPYTSSSSETMNHGALVARKLGIPMKTLSIAAQVDGYFTQLDDEATRLRRANMMARQRMTILYDQSADFGAHSSVAYGESGRYSGFSWVWRWPGGPAHDVGHPLPEHYCRSRVSTYLQRNDRGRGLLSLGS